MGQLAVAAPATAAETDLDEYGQLVGGDVRVLVDERRRAAELGKRALDVTCAPIGVMLLAPLALLIAVAVRIDSPGTILFRQRRVGRGGRQFEMLKFRTMFDGAHALHPAVDGEWTVENLFKLVRDPRVTRIGRWLRRASLDELPQLINVLRGDMSMVGPRPLIPEEDRLIVGAARERLRARPGLTGPWQCTEPRVPLSEMLELDRHYVDEWTLLSDVRILLATVSHVVRFHGV